MDGYNHIKRIFINIYPYTYFIYNKILYYVQISHINIKICWKNKDVINLMNPLVIFVVVVVVSSYINTYISSRSSLFILVVAAVGSGWRLGIFFSFASGEKQDFVFVNKLVDEEKHCKNK